MQYEVEQKFPVDDLEEAAEKLRALGADIHPAVLQSDTYYAHPCRDFGKTDEALRIRRVGQVNVVTYKGPKIDATTKTRRELELPLPAGEAGAAEFAVLLAALGFARVAEVRKHRRRAVVPWRGRSVEAALDDVDGVGTFVELELLAEESRIDDAKACLASLATELGLSTSQRLSYLELLLGE